MTHPYFTRKAAAYFGRAGGDPDLAGPLADWAEAARAVGDWRHGVLVAEDGTLIATTRWARPDQLAFYWLDELLVEVDEQTRWRIGFREGLSGGYRVMQTIGALQRAVGQRIVEVRYSDVCTGAGQKVA